MHLASTPLAEKALDFAQGFVKLLFPLLIPAACR
jgi:hypothetical protein